MKHFYAWAIACLICLASEVMAAKPNIVFILSDDQSYPFLGCYGRKEMKTPTLDNFAAQGMKFSRMFTSAPQCVPSRATLMTGRSPVACRISRFSSPLPREETTFPELLRTQAGYFVGVCGRSYHLDGSHNASASEKVVFDTYGMNTFKDRFNYLDASSQDHIEERMNEFFDQRPKDRPYFLWVNYNDPHYPWDTGKNPPDPSTVEVPGYLPDLPGVRKDLSLHEGEIEHLDALTKMVLDIIKTRAGLENTLFIFMGDNGMALPSGKGSLHDPGLNVPLLVWWSGVVKPGTDSNALLSGEDLAPTCLEAAGVAVPKRITGISFLPVLLGRTFPNERQYIFGERGPHGDATFDIKSTTAQVDYSRCVRSSHYKLIYNVTPNLRYVPVDSCGAPSWKEITRAHEQHQLASEFEALYFTSPRPIYELYDLQQDPNELKNLYGLQGTEDVTRELKTALQAKMVMDYDYLPLTHPEGKDSKKQHSENESGHSED